jgi:hypothetical protein
MADTDTLSRPSPKPVRSGLTDKAEVSHIVEEDDWFNGYVLGEEVVALCGFKWIPFRDPEKLPICPACLEILQSRESYDG